jgi:hypothetical protein
MTWIRKDAIVGIVEDADALNQRLEDMKRLRGSAAGQTVIDTLAQMSFFDQVSSGDLSFDFRKKTLTVDTPRASVAFVAEDFETPTDIENIIGMTWDHTIRTADLMSEQVLMRWGWARLAASTGAVILSAIQSDAEMQNLTIAPDGSVGVFYTVPTYPLDVGAGVLNVVGDYRIAGNIVSDWTEVPGTPNAATWDGDAVVSKYWRTTIATGTAPIDVTSPEECTRLDVELLAGFGWHPGVFDANFVDNETGYTSSDTDILEVPLDRAGEWEIAATVGLSVNPDDAGLNHLVKLKDGGDVQIGRTVTFKGQALVIGGSLIFGGTTYGVRRCVLVTGPYTAATDSESVKVTVAATSGSGGSARAFINARWLGP